MGSVRKIITRNFQNKSFPGIPGIYLYQLHTVQRAGSDTTSDKMTRLKGINYCVDKQVATEDKNCFPPEKSHMAEAVIGDKSNKTGH